MREKGRDTNHKITYQLNGTLHAYSKTCRECGGTAVREGGRFCLMHSALPRGGFVSRDDTPASRRGRVYAAVQDSVRDPAKTGIVFVKIFRDEKK